MSQSVIFSTASSQRGNDMFGQRLRLARKRAGLTLQSLAGKLDPKITAQAVSKYEAGKMMPSSAVLVGIGKVLDVSLDFLMSSQVEVLEGLEFRKHSGTSARDHAMAEAILIDNLERYSAIEEITGEPSTSCSFEGFHFDRVATEEQIDSAADALRGKWDLGLDPVLSLCALLEDKGIMVVEDDLPERINGLACRVQRVAKPVADAIIVSNRTNVERKRFTLAHELAHRIIRSTGNPAYRLEKAMDRFAGAFLVPKHHLLSEVGRDRHRVTYHEIIHLKHIYGVSASAMLLRLGQVGVLQQSWVQHAFRTFARAWRKEEPEPLGRNQGFAAFEKPRRFERLVWRAIGEGLISTVRAADMLKVSLGEVERQIRGPESN